MKIYILLLIIALSFSPLKSQTSQAANKPRTDSAYAHPGLNGLGIGGGYGPNFSTINIVFRKSFWGITFQATAVNEASDLSGQLDYDPPHNDYHIENYKTAIMGLTFDYYQRFYKDFLLHGSLGISFHIDREVPVSNATGWLYATKDKTISCDGAVGGVGISYAFSRSFELGAQYRNIFGATIDLIYFW